MSWSPKKKDATTYWSILTNSLILDLFTSCAHFEAIGLYPLIKILLNSCMLWRKKNNTWNKCRSHNKSYSDIWNDGTIYRAILINLLILDLCTSYAHFEAIGFVHRLHYYWWIEIRNLKKLNLEGIVHCTLTTGT